MSVHSERPGFSSAWGSARFVFWGWTAGWTAVVAFVAAIVLGDSHRAKSAAARIRAEEICRSELRLHSADAGLGGVYATVTEQLTPDPRLERLPQRDLSTPTGQKLTLVSPTHRRRSTTESAPDGELPRARMLGLDAAPGAAESLVPDAWEAAALKRLTLLERAVGEHVTLQGRPVLRYLGGVILDAQCSVCHAPARRAVGEVVGGISVSIPLDTGPSDPSNPAKAACAGLGACWIIGLLWLRRSFRDVQQRLQDAQAINLRLTESEARFRLVFEEGPLGLILTDAEGRFTQVNRAFAEMLGCSQKELLGRNILEVIHEECLPACRELLSQSEASPHKVYRLEQCYLGRNGSRVWGNVTAVFLRREDGRPLGRLAMVQDTTARRSDESRLREQAALLDIAQDAICVQSLDGRIEFWNPAAERLYGWTRDEVLGAPGQDLLFGRVSKELLQAQADVISLGSWTGELTQAGRGGRVIQTQSRFSLVRDASGKPKSILIVSTDLTDRKRLEQQFLRAQRLECIGALASGVAHDLNNVFSPILMVADCLAGRNQDPNDAELIELVRNSAERGAGVVRQLLAFSRGQEIDRVELRVDQLLKEMSRLARETFPKNISFSTYLAPDLWAIVGDVVQLHQVLLNLCVNARDAMPNGGRLNIAASNFRADAIFCQMTPEAQPRPYVLLEITDTGEGIPPEIIDRIFDPFFTTKAPGKGTGLGLPTVTNIVKAHQGFLEVHSRVGHGTRFRLFIPAVAPAEFDPPAPEQVCVFDGQGEKVLVLDDEEAVCESVRKVLQGYHYRAVTTANGTEAIRYLAQAPDTFRVVITDMMMPGMEGPAFIRAVRKISPTVPILVMSGSQDHREDARDAAESRVHFLEKPFTGDALIKAIQAACRQSGASTPPPAGTEPPASDPAGPPPPSPSAPA
jgi:two-component system cell cycle sensor histidine kinase/response regulator CckA